MIGNLTDQEARKIMDLTVKYYFEGLSTEEAREKAVKQFREEKANGNRDC